MNKKINTRMIVITALLIGFGILIPTAFSFLRVILPPAFTATLTAHVPIFIAMFISPWSAIFTAIGTTVGFLLTGLDPVVTARAGSHIVFAVVGAYMIQKRYGLIPTGIVTCILHGLFEALTTYLFLALGWTTPASGSSFLTVAFYTTGIGTLLHHCVDYIIACVVGYALMRAHVLPQLPPLWKRGTKPTIAA
jgi:niacin transporter